MDQRWLKGTTSKEDKDKRKKKVLTYRTAFKELDQLLELLDKNPKVSDYSLPAWPYHRADMDGFNRAINQIRSLINLKD